MNLEITNHQAMIIDNATVYIDLLKAEAARVLDNYWQAWGGRNKAISAASYASGGKFTPGRFAPVVKKVGSAQKITIVWKDFSPKFKKRVEHYGVIVKPKLGGYSVSCFPNALDWELEMILETESKIKPIRELLQVYHERRLADIKRLNKLKELL